ncbi:MAG: YHYH protein [Ignavibacteriae bacterium]|nr:YHYH protein [Ignavibacteriota bacterium]MCB9242597.1 YHYH protein [Ignavibacteriales bacterium]
MKNIKINIVLMLVTAGIIAGCNDSDTVTSVSSTDPELGDALVTTYHKFYGAYEVSFEGDYVVMKTKGRPEHPSPYYQGTQWEGSLYEPYNGTNQNFHQNPNHINEFNFTFKIPLHPQASGTPTPTPLGPIGVALNGVPIFNQYAAGGVPLTGEINSFDQYGGHPTGNHMYHYHVEPLYLTTLYGRDALVGYLLDGFPVYGPVENGKVLTTSTLDAYHGHFGVTREYPNGIYHYHITDDAPYINGDGFYGTPGTVTQ